MLLLNLISILTCCNEVSSDTMDNSQCSDDNYIVCVLIALPEHHVDPMPVVRCRKRSIAFCDVLLPGVNIPLILDL